MTLKRLWLLSLVLGCVGCGGGGSSTSATSQAASQTIIPPPTFTPSLYSGSYTGSIQEPVPPSSVNYNGGTISLAIAVDGGISGTILNPSIGQGTVDGVTGPLLNGVVPSTLTVTYPAGQSGGSNTVFILEGSLTPQATTASQPELDGDFKEYVDVQSSSGPGRVYLRTVKVALLQSVH